MDFFTKNYAPYIKEQREYVPIISLQHNSCKIVLHKCLKEENDAKSSQSLHLAREGWMMGFHPKDQVKAKSLERRSKIVICRLLWTPIVWIIEGYLAQCSENSF
jgi:hypothetical protein